MGEQFAHAHLAVERDQPARRAPWVDGQPQVAIDAEEFEHRLYEIWRIVCEDGQVIPRLIRDPMGKGNAEKSLDLPDRIVVAHQWGVVELRHRWHRVPRV